MADDFDWPGWPLGNNPYGEEFGLAARKRMVKGSRMLLPLIKKHLGEIGEVLLEVGPFFNPLLTASEFPDKTIFYWENDRHVLNWLRNENGGRGTYAIYCDLGKIGGKNLLELKRETQACFEKSGREKRLFDSVVASHVLNYIDYRLFLIVLRDFLKDGGLLFINNVADYGLPDFFSQERPRSMEETLKTLEETGYEIMEKEVLPAPDKGGKRNERLILLARKRGD